MKRIFTLLVVFTLLLSFSFAEGQDPQVGKAKKYEKGIPTKVIKKVPLTRGYHEGLFFDGKNIWVNNGKNGNTWIVNPDTGDIISQIKPIGTFTEGLTAAGDGSFWVTDWDEKKLYRVNVTDNKMVEEYSVPLAPVHPAGVAWTGDRLYVITWTRGMGTKYHLLEYDGHGNRMRKLHIKGIHEPAHLAWDGEHLWITSWYNRLVYRMDVSTFEITGSFKSPAADTTGIVWDGNSFWITGTHVGLYQVKLEK